MDKKQLIAIENLEKWLYRKIRKKRQALGAAEKRPGCTAEELANLKNSIEILEYICGVVLAKGD